jgi:hypothetical protein
MGQNWEPVLREDKLKVALAQKAEARLTAMELENRLKELRARRLAPEDQKRSGIGARRVSSPTLDALPRINRNRVHSLPLQARKTAQAVEQEISRFSRKERTYMPGSRTTQGRAGARSNAPVRIAFRYANSVGTLN